MNPIRIHRWTIFIVVLAIIVVIIDAAGGELPLLNRNIDPKLGLDLSGGTKSYE
jgi:preprotein translocase subunit SecD